MMAPKSPGSGSKFKFTLQFSIALLLEFESTLVDWWWIAFSIFAWSRVTLLAKFLLILCSLLLAREADQVKKCLGFRPIVGKRIESWDEVAMLHPFVCICVKNKLENHDWKKNLCLQCRVQWISMRPQKKFAFLARNWLSKQNWTHDFRLSIWIDSAWVPTLLFSPREWMLTYVIGGIWKEKLNNSFPLTN